MQLVFTGVMQHRFRYGCVLPAEVVVAVLAWIQSVRVFWDLANEPEDIRPMGW